MSVSMYLFTQHFFVSLPEEKTQEAKTTTVVERAYPGEMELTRIPKAASSTPNALASDRTAPLLAQ